MEIVYLFQLLNKSDRLLGIDKQTKFLLALIIGICIGLMFDKNFGLFRADGTAPAGR